jgi:hypothetical protein
MDKFVLMQEPAKWVSDKKGYFTIGLKELYPNKGFGSCDENGFSDYIGPGKNKTAFFAFLDDETKKSFKGDTEKFKEFNGKEVEFAAVKIKE